MLNLAAALLIALPLDLPPRCDDYNQPVPCTVYDTGGQPFWCDDNGCQPIRSV